jgi:hypothetical protein
VSTHRADTVAPPAEVVAEAFKRLPLSLMVADGWSYTKEDLGHLAVGALLEAGYVVVPRKVSPKGPRAQVITPSDSVLTREGQILAVALHAAEERELDLLAKIGRLERQIDGTVSDV